MLKENKWIAGLIEKCNPKTIKIIPIIKILLSKKFVWCCKLALKTNQQLQYIIYIFFRWPPTQREIHCRSLLVYYFVMLSMGFESRRTLLNEFRAQSVGKNSTFSWYEIWRESLEVPRHWRVGWAHQTLSRICH